MTEWDIYDTLAEGKKKKEAKPNETSKYTPTEGKSYYVLLVYIRTQKPNIYSYRQTAAEQHLIHIS